MKSRRRLLVTLVGGAILISPASPTAATDAPSTEAPNTTPVDTDAAASEGTFGGTLVHLHGFEAPSLDVLLGRAENGTASDAAMLNAIYDLLFYEDSQTGELKMQLAESLESSDYINWTLRLRPGILFSDGTPLNAEAVKFNWERVADPANASRNAAGPGQITAMTVEDEVTLQITIGEVNAQFGRDLASTAPWIASPTAIEAAGADYGVDNAVGAGPFVLDSWTRDSEMVLTRNPNYWNAPLPYLDELVIRQVPDPESRFQTWAAGDANSSYTSTAVDLAPRAEEAGGVLTETTSPVGGLAFILNTTRAPFDDPRARLAFTRAIDRDLLNDTLAGGANDPADHIIREPSPFFNPDYAVQFDHDGAQQLFDELAGEGKSTSFTLVTTAAGAPFAEAIQAQLLGYDNVSAEIEQIANTDITARGSSGDFDALITSVSAIDPGVLYELLRTDARRNTGGYSNPDMDAALDAQSETLDEDERREAFDEVQAIFLEDAPMFFFTVSESYWFYHPEVQGLTSIPREGPLWEQVWLKTD